MRPAGPGRMPFANPERDAVLTTIRVPSGRRAWRVGAVRNAALGPRDDPDRRHGDPAVPRIHEAAHLEPVGGVSLDFNAAGNGVRLRCDQLSNRAVNAQPGRTLSFPVP